MTKARAADLQAKWKQQSDPPPLCEHPIQELAHLARTDDGLMKGTYYCGECGEAIVHTYEAPPISNKPRLD